MDTGSILLFLTVILSLLFNYYLIIIIIIIIPRFLVALIIRENIRLEIFSIIIRYLESSCCG